MNKKFYNVFYILGLLAAFTLGLFFSRVTVLYSVNEKFVNGMPVVAVKKDMAFYSKWDQFLLSARNKPVISEVSIDPAVLERQIFLPDSSDLLCCIARDSETKNLNNILFAFPVKSVSGVEKYGYTYLDDNADGFFDRLIQRNASGTCEYRLSINEKGFVEINLGDKKAK